MVEESRQPDWRDANRSPGQKISGVIERREERDAQSAIRHCIEQAVAGRREEQEGEQRDPGDLRLKSHDSCCGYRGEKCCKNERMGESAVSPEVTVVNTEAESDHVQIGNHRTSDSRGPYARGHAAAVKHGTDSCYSNSM